MLLNLINLGSKKKKLRFTAFPSTFVFFLLIYKTAKGVTSAPVPAVVGIQIKLQNLEEYFLFKLIDFFSKAKTFADLA